MNEYMSNGGMNWKGIGISLLWSWDVEQHICLFTSHSLALGSRTYLSMKRNHYFFLFVQYSSAI